MRCEEAALELLDDVGAVSDDALTHVESCRRCRELVGAHRAALALRGLRTVLATRTAEVPVRSLARRRLVLRTTFAALCVAVASVVAVSLGDDAGNEPREYASASDAPADVIAPAQLDVEDLLLEVDSYTRERALVDDAALAPLGEMQRLVAPSITPTSTVGIHQGGLR